MHKSLIAVLLLAVIAACAASNPNGNQELLRFAERAERVEQAANVPDTEGSDEDEGAMTEEDVKKAKAAGYSDEQIAKEQMKAARVAAKTDAAKNAIKEQEQVLNAAADKTAKKAGEAAAKEAEKEAKGEAEMEKAAEEAQQKKKEELIAKEKKEEVQKKVLDEVVVEAKKEAAAEAANAVEKSPQEILEAEKVKRQEQFLTSLTPEAIASAQVELSSVFSGVLGSLLTNLLSKEPELIQRHLYAKRPENNDPTKVQLVQEGLAVPKTSL